MKKLIAIIALLLGAVFSFSHQPSRAWVAQLPGCSQSAAFLARVAAQDGTHTAAYQNLICGLVSDGVWSKLDDLHILAAADSATALTNLVSSCCGASAVNSPTFSADHGYTGNGTSSYINTGYNPTSVGGNYTQNSASFGVYVLTGRTSGADYCEIGVTNVAMNSADFFPWAADGNTYAEVNANDSAHAASVVKGMWVLTRTGASAVATRHNGSSFSTSTTASVATIGANFFLFAKNNAGSAIYFSADQISAYFGGGGLTSTQMDAVASRINGYMTALGINVY